MDFDKSAAKQINFNRRQREKITHILWKKKSNTYNFLIVWK